MPSDPSARELSRQQGWLEPVRCPHLAVGTRGRCLYMAGAGCRHTCSGGGGRVAARAEASYGLAGSLWRPWLLACFPMAAYTEANKG